MKKNTLFALATILFLVPSVFASESPAEQEIKAALDRFGEGCQAELNSYCKDVTPGENRILACLYAFSDKLSPRCEMALYDSIGQLNRTVTNLAYTTHECDADLTNNCSNIQPGEGRLLECLKKNKTNVSKRCLDALKDVGWVK
ncbi:cysteine rich repeat-containing protein [Desulfogranum marinum]|uniref:cysteine rich repeat-containing protein n=1 Tax=Desulfogranum marinum TaxID=453220 RepID=UPI0029C908F2|nr:cysteine rich repeat-containing protein [Desulfogranum marinum]